MRARARGAKQQSDVKEGCYKISEAALDAFLEELPEGKEIYKYVSSAHIDKEGNISKVESSQFIDKRVELYQQLLAMQKITKAD